MIQEGAKNAERVEFPVIARHPQHDAVSLFHQEETAGLTLAKLYDQVIQAWGQSECGELLDSNQDGYIGVEDLMNLLSHFGDSDSDLDGVFDSVDLCTDLTACNYLAQPTEPCGLDADGDGVCDFYCGANTVHHYGYEYPTVQIGDQCWFSENCRYLPEVSPPSEGNDTDPFYYVYGYQGTDVEAAQSNINYATTGVLYNWPAVMTDNICPSGWHIPSDAEWRIMEISLGMSYAEAEQYYWRGSPVGDYLKSSTGWNVTDQWSGNGSNSSGFAGLPGGECYVGIFQNIGAGGIWWTSTVTLNHRTRRLDINDNVGRWGFPLDGGAAVRCLKDTE